MDWGMGEFTSKHWGLRDNIALPAWFYYCAVLFDACARGPYAIYISPGALLYWTNNCTHVVSFVILSIMVLCLLLHQRLELQNSDAQSFLFIRVLCFVLYLHHVLSVSSQLVLNFSRFLFERSCFLSVTLSLLS